MDIWWWTLKKSANGSDLGPCKSLWVFVRLDRFRGWVCLLSLIVIARTAGSLTLFVVVSTHKVHWSFIFLGIAVASF